MATKPDPEQTPPQPATTAAPKPEAPPAPVKLESFVDDKQRRTPEQWGTLFGLLPRRDPARPWLELNGDWRFAAAERLHGWAEHAHHYQGQPLELILDDFKAALEAGAEYPARPAHRAACGKGFEGRADKPTKALSKSEARRAEVKNG